MSIKKRTRSQLLPFEIAGQSLGTVLVHSLCLVQSTIKTCFVAKPVHDTHSADMQLRALQSTLADISDAIQNTQQELQKFCDENIDPGHRLSRSSKTKHVQTNDIDHCLFVISLLEVRINSGVSTSIY
jgi:hypothetical protein